LAERYGHRGPRPLVQAVVRQLATCRWVREHHNVLISGPTGAGKSYVACALAQQACRQGFRSLYRRATRLRDELILAHADGTYARLLARFERIDVVVIDDWGTGITQEQERNDLLEIIDDRHGARSTIVASQLPIDKWHAKIGDPTIADAILDRLSHNAHRVVLKGASRRKGTVKIDTE
jgi:DNA replication protein DnaC